jgi:hypothetical protein
VQENLWGIGPIYCVNCTNSFEPPPKAGENVGAAPA